MNLLVREKSHTEGIAFFQVSERILTTFEHLTAMCIFTPIPSLFYEESNPVETTTTTISVYPIVSVPCNLQNFKSNINEQVPEQRVRV